MGFDTLDTYDVATCASRCTAKNGCVSINIYFERDPSGKLFFFKPLFIFLSTLKNPANITFKLIPTMLRAPTLPR